MTDAERLVVAIRLAVDEARQGAVDAMTSGCRSWEAYQYERGRHDAFVLAMAQITEAFENLGKDDEP